MRKALLILVAVALLGIMAATFWPNPPAKPTSSQADTTAINQPKTSTAAATSPTTSAGGPVYKDGSFTINGNNRYESLVLDVTISGGRLTAVEASATPRDSESQVYIDYALPKLKQQALSAQSANLDGVSGATMLSQTYQSSLQAALDQAFNG